ncbi:MAG: hypothetical protein QMD46_01550 [Methanomicrobiales archaeon]|nr:hypothetical protein [Methanomicrobiales archaeon]MDI6875782.1 hypothetical protein [Methanomicrobiales archaeon]
MQAPTCGEEGARDQSDGDVPKPVDAVSPQDQAALDARVNLAATR